MEIYFICILVNQRIILPLKIKSLVVDLGNTNTKIAFFSGDDLLQKSENLSEREIIKVTKQEKPDSVLICSVRKGINRFKGAMSKHATTMVLDHSTKVPFNILYKTPKTLGTDRIAAVAGARYLFPDRNCLIIDSGTCITYDVLDQKGNYLGGAISPGVNMRLKAMHKFTSKLPLVVFKGPEELIGRTTKECILSGAVNGAIAELEGIIHQYKTNFGDLVILICGGNTNFFESNLKGSIFAVPDLVLTGLNQILRLNGQNN